MATRRLLVLGATGGTGRQVVTRAVELGFDVTALVRNPAAVTGSGVRVLAGDVIANSASLDAAVNGQDAIISALGVGSSLKSGGLISRAAPAILGAMRHKGVRRLVFTSAYGIGATRRDLPLLPRIVTRLLLRDIYADKEVGEAAILSSDLDWTIVYPVTLTNGPRTGSYRVGERLALHGLPRISRADVADCLLAQLESPAFVRKGVLVAH